MSKFVYDVSINLTISNIDMWDMLSCSWAHYDRKCREVGQVGGFLYGMKLQMGHEPKTMSFPFTQHQLDTLMKVLEGSEHHSLRCTLIRAFEDINREQRRLIEHDKFRFVP